MQIILTRFIQVWSSSVAQLSKGRGDLRRFSLHLFSVIFSSLNPDSHDKYIVSPRYLRELSYQTCSIFSLDFDIQVGE